LYHDQKIFYSTTGSNRKKLRSRGGFKRVAPLSHMDRHPKHAGENALTDGGKVTMPLAETFWATKFGMLEDRFGIGWMVSVQHKG